jgi:hypothetical protein
MRVHGPHAGVHRSTALDYLGEINVASTVFVVLDRLGGRSVSLSNLFTVSPAEGAP